MDPGPGQSGDYPKHTPPARCKGGIWRVKTRPAPPGNEHYVRVSADAKYLELTLPSSKTDPFQQGITLTIVASSDAACPVKAMRLLQGRY